MDKDEILEEIAKILIPYKNEDYLENVKSSFYGVDFGHKILIDIIGDINDRFKGFNSIYNKACHNIKLKETK